MARSSFAGLTIEALMELRDEVVAQLGTRRVELEAMIERIGGAPAVPRLGRPPGKTAHSLKGRKVAAKYRGPGGETWAGRGMTPGWLVALMKQGRKKEEFAVGMTRTRKAAAKRKKRAVKRSRRKS
ncbi:MAG: H-NS family nucleoid-associated regulatory protein [Candidatus Sulfotelmatobacter sp.]